jgi:hypothetical protein
MTSWGQVHASTSLVEPSVLCVGAPAIKQREHLLSVRRFQQIGVVESREVIASILKVVRDQCKKKNGEDEKLIRVYFAAFWRFPRVSPKPSGAGAVRATNGLLNQTGDASVGNAKLSHERISVNLVVILISVSSL